jgi:DNA processing protein
MPASSISEKEEQLHWLALTMVPGLGSRLIQRLLQRFRTPVAVFRAAKTELESAGLPGGLAQSIASGCSFDDAVQQQDSMQRHGAVGISITDSRYPAGLREIVDPPVFLFVLGDVELLGTLMLAVVGTRRPTPYGLAAAERLSADLASAGLTVVSGLARGIDTAAHKGALSVEGKTVAVLGCGVDLVYPAENRRLSDEIAKKGALISEFPMGAPPFPQNFPIRNRIVSGFSLGVLVVEGAQYSGSAITARLALEQGREVYAVPGNITSKMSWGPNLLIKQGAKLVQDWNDVVVELPIEERRRLAAESRKRLGLEASEQDSARQESLPLGPLAPMAQAVLNGLAVDTATHIDDLLDRMENGSSSELLAALFELELLGLVKQLPGKNFIKVW